MRSKGTFICIANWNVKETELSIGFCHSRLLNQSCIHKWNTREKILALVSPTCNCSRQRVNAQIDVQPTLAVPCLLQSRKCFLWDKTWNATSSRLCKGTRRWFVEKWPQYPQRYYRRVSPCFVSEEIVFWVVRTRSNNFSKVILLYFRLIVFFVFIGEKKVNQLGISLFYLRICNVSGKYVRFLVFSKTSNHSMKMLLCSFLFF